MTSNRPDSVTHSTTAPVNPSNLPGGFGEHLEEEQERPSPGRREINGSVKRALDLHMRGQLDGQPLDTAPLKGELKHATVIDEGACLLRNTSLPSSIRDYRHGEVQVMFYNYSSMQGDVDLEDEEDEEEDEDDDELSWEERRQKRRRKLEEARRRRYLLHAANRESDKYEVIPLQYLYQSETGLPMMEYENFPVEVQELSGLKIIEFPACYYATEFLEAMQKHNNRNEFNMDLPSVLDSENLQLSKQNPGFKTGVSLRATRNNSSEYLTLLAAIPYFGKPPKTKFERDPTLDERYSIENEASRLTGYLPVKERGWWRRESLSLAEYRFLGPCNQEISENQKSIKRHESMKNELREERPIDQEIIVHQAWFMLFDNFTMGAFKSVDDQLGPQPPLYPYQEKIGAFHALVHAISNTLERSEKILLDTYRAKISELEFGYQYLINDGEDDEDINVETGEDDRKDKGYGPKQKEISVEILALKGPKSLARMVEKVVLQISTINSVVESQIQILKDLREIFRISIGLESRRPHGGTVQIPIMSDQREQIRAAEKSLNAVIEERDSFSEKLNVLFNNIKSLSHSLAGRGTEDAIERQANTMSMFTLVTTLFLPLGFFSSYATLDAAKYAFTTQAAFWRIYGPVTAVFVLATFVVIIHKKRRSERLIIRLGLLLAWLRKRLLGSGDGGYSEPEDF